MAQQFIERSALWIAELDVLFFNIGDRCGWDTLPVLRKVGRIENRKLGVFLAYARGQALLADCIWPGVDACPLWCCGDSTANARVRRQAAIGATND